MITLDRVPLDDPTARLLWDEQQAELFARYGEPDADADFAAELPPDGLITSLVAVTAEGEPVGTALLRWSPFPNGAGVAEVKRLYVRPEHRGRGYSRVLMGAAEKSARAAGATRIVLETGVEQPEAMGLYAAIGYSRIEPYGDYMDDPRSVCFGRELATRVLVVNGTIGAGKTKVSGAVFDVLGERGARVAMIDGDYLCQASPTTLDDPFGQSLMFENLAAVAPVYRARGFGLVVIARVVEDATDRSRYSRAFAAGDLRGEVVIARVTAPEAERKERIVHRDIDPAWQEWGHARTVELEASLDELALDDVVIDNTGRTPADTAAELIAEIGW